MPTFCSFSQFRMGYILCFTFSESSSSYDFLFLTWDSRYVSNLSLILSNLLFYFVRFCEFTIHFVSFIFDVVEFGIVNIFESFSYSFIIKLRFDYKICFYKNIFLLLITSSFIFEKFLAALFWIIVKTCLIPINHYCFWKMF